jgi:hypothetical protein
VAKATVVITGDKQIDRILRGMPLKLQKKISRQATRKASKEIVLKRATTDVPTDTGKLKASLAVRAMKARKGRFGHQVETKKGVYGGEGQSQFPGAFLEFGTKERFHKTITYIKGGVEHTTGKKYVGRIQPKKFGYLRKAVYNNQTPISDLYIKAMREFIAEAAAGTK